MRKDAGVPHDDTSRRTYAVIGAGPSGLAAARNLQRLGIPWSGYELGDDVGGLWNIDGPRSTVYESAHLISSRTTTEFTEFPMKETVADYPSHRELLAYFRDFATAFDLRSGFAFGTEVTRVERTADGWEVTADGPERGAYDGARRRGDRQRHALRAGGADLRGIVRRRDPAHQRLQEGRGVRRQAGADHRRRQLRLRHRRRRRPPRRLGRHERAARLPLRAEVPLRQARRHPQPGPAAAAADQAGRRQPGAADVHR